MVFKHSEETKKRMSEIMKAKWQDKKSKYNTKKHQKFIKEIFSKKFNENKKISEETRQKISKANKINRYNEKNPLWKGDNVGKNSLHGWVKRRKIKPELCERCNKTEPYDLANISGKYKRDINDYEWICRKCHIHSDGRLNNLKQYKRGEVNV